jgi:hypothetical protein
MLHHIVQWCNTALISFNAGDTITLPTYQTTATPFLKLLLTFESLFLSPSLTPNQSQQSFHQLLLHRHALLKAGNLQQLYMDTRTPLHQSPKTPIPIFNDMQHNHAAQFAADQDNLHSAYHRIKSITPKVTLAPHYLTILQSLYPPQRQYHPPTQRNTRSQTTPVTSATPLTDAQLLKTLHKQKRGTAPGPFADSVDLFRDYATHQTHRHQLSYPYLFALTSLLNSFLHNNIPPDIQPTFAAQYVIALHKDQHNLDKIRPIGIGTALRRLTAAASLIQHGTTIASFLIPHGQLGINVPGGLDFIVHSTQAQLNTFMSPNQPTQALLTLDIANMFNAISRQACRHALLQDNTLQPLLPFFDLLYHQHNRCWYQTPQGTYQQFPQEEGFTQGCPLSGAFADIVLTQVLQPLNQQLQQRIRLRSPTAIPPTTLSYHDDTSIVLPYPDLEWFITQFQALGNPLGICLNLSKTQLLTSLTSDPPTLSTEDQHHRLHFLQLLGTKVEHYQGYPSVHVHLLPPILPNKPQTSTTSSHNNSSTVFTTTKHSLLYSSTVHYHPSFIYLPPTSITPITTPCPPPYFIGTLT